MPILIHANRLDDPRVIALLDHHVTTARAQTAPESAHALDLSGLKAPGISFWSAWEDETLLGTGALKRLDADHGEVKSMHTTAAFRRMGVASLMLGHIISEARKAGMKRLSLETGAQTYFLPAVALYKKHGFVECPPFGDYEPDPNSLFLTLSLAPAR
jgi:putative acetyltransferase